MLLIITPDFSNPLLGTFFAGLAAWKAANLLDVDNRIVAILAATALAVAGPMLVKNTLMDVMGPTAPGGTPAKTARLLMLPLLASRIGFALLGVFAWSLVETRRA